MIKNKHFINIVMLPLIFIFTILVWYKYIALLATNEYWKDYSYPWEKLWYLLVPLIIASISYLVCRKRGFCLFKSMLIVWAFFLLCMCVLSHVPGLLLSLILVCFQSIIFFFWGQVCCRWLKISSDVLVNILLGTIVFHHIVFLLSALKILNMVNLYSLLIVNFTIAFYYNRFKLLSNIKNCISGWKVEVTFFEVILVSCLFFTMFLAFVNMTSPQTYPDGVVERLPYLHQLLSHGTFPEHYMKWALLIPLPMNIILIGSYGIAGELGASIHLYLYAIVFVLFNYRFMKYFKLKRTVNLVALNLLMIISPVWILTTIVYFDISIALFSIAGLLFFLKSLDREDYKYLLIAFIFWGFAVSIKLNAALFVVSCLISVLIIFNKKLYFIFKNIIGITLAFLFSWLPWTLRTFIMTGNPLFPFGSFLNKKDFQGANVLTSDALKAFEFNGSLVSFFRIPWDLVFSTGSFGEYLPGTFNPIILILSLVCFFLMLFFIRKNFFLKKEYFLLLSGLFSIYFVSYFLKASLLRYWLAGLVIVLIFMASVFDKFFLIVEIKRKKLNSFAMVLIVFLSLAIHLIVGARLNYFLPYGLGDSLWFGFVSREKFSNEATVGIPEFINANIAANESVFLTHFFFANKIKNPTVFISEDNALFGRLKTIENFESYINKYNVRYWVVNNEVPLTFNKKIKEKYIQNQYISYASGKYIVYNLKKETKTPINNLSEDLMWVNPQGVSLNSYSFKQFGVLCFERFKQSLFFQIEVSLTCDVEKSNFISQIIKYNMANVEIDRKGSGRVISKGANEIILFSSLDPETHKICVQVNPWKSEDGNYSIYKTKVTFY